MTSEHFSRDKVDWFRCYHVAQARYEQAPEIQLRADDLLIMKDGAAMGKLAYLESVPGPACLNSHLLLIRPLNGRFVNRFMFYLMSGPRFTSYIEQNKTGSTFFGISQESIGSLVVALPPISEQQQIALFLDCETERIDVLTSRLERLIEILREGQKAVINRTVTSGLDSNVPMKDSGLPWLGSVPAHWAIRRLKHLSSFLTSGSRGWAGHYSDDGQIFLRIGNLTRDGIDLDLSDIQRVQPPTGAEGDRTSVRSGDLLVSITADIGSVAIVPGDLGAGFVNQHLALDRPPRKYPRVWRKRRQRLPSCSRPRMGPVGRVPEKCVNPRLGLCRPWPLR